MFLSATGFLIYAAAQEMEMYHVSSFVKKRRMIIPAKIFFKLDAMRNRLDG